MRTVNNTKIHCEIFDSFGEFIRKAKSNTAPQSSNQRDFGDGDEGWSQSRDLQDATNKASEGWHDIRPEVDIVLDVLEERLAERLSSLYVNEFAMSGSSVDMGRFVTGEPECMVEWAPMPEESMGRVVKILVSGTASSMISAEDIKRRGIAILALIDSLHKMGVGIELWWESPIKGSSDKRTYSTVVKMHDSSEPMDIDSIMFAMAHPSMLRRLVFSVQELSPTASQQNVGGGYGRPTEVVMGQVQDFDVVVERLQSGSGDIVNNPLEWVMTTVKGLGLVGKEA
jgi:hypothetical protein